jgi:hypothetical protein
MRRLWIFALMAQALCACSGTPSLPGREIFEERTGNTLTVVSKPIVFARDRSDVAAYARDYATLVAIEVDQSGTFKDYLLLYRWSTVDSRMLSRPQSNEGAMRLLSEGRELNLEPLESLPVNVVSDRELHVPHHGAALMRAYAIDLATLRFIAASRALTLQMPQESLNAPFTIWEDGRPALNRFVRQISAE